MVRLRRWSAVALVAAAIAIAYACGGGGGLKAAGEACVASSECDLGLVCDLAQQPPVCASTGGLPPADAPPVVDDAAIDARDDVDGPPPPDAAIDAPPDAAIDAPPDAAVDAPPDAAP